MALVDPYSPCPCGSEKKFKWCCQKAEVYVDRAIRLVENGQPEMALAALDEGLAKARDNTWLLQRKAVVLIAQKKFREARGCVAQVLRNHPDNYLSALIQIRLTRAIDGPVAAALQLQQVLLKTSPELRSRLASEVAGVAEDLGRAECFPAALNHYKLAASLVGGDGGSIAAAYHSIKADPRIDGWLKEPLVLTPPPEGLAGPPRRSFEDALGWAGEGLWAAAAAAFDLLTADPVAGQAAERNVGLCRLWLGDEEAAAAALRRWIDRGALGDEALDLAVVYLTIDATPDPEPVEQVQLTWPLRDGAGLRQTLGALGEFVAGADRPLDGADENSPEVACLHWLDRPVPEARPGLPRTEIPLVQADVLIGADTVVLECEDDGRLNTLIDRFTALVGKAVPPAHPRTRVIGQSTRLQNALSWRWYLAPELPMAERIRLNDEQTAHVLASVWPETPLPYLGGRTPVQAGRSGKPELLFLLRANLLELEAANGGHVKLVDWQGLRSRLGLPPEPAIDPATVDIASLSLGRLALVPVERLDDARLDALSLRADEWGLHGVFLRAAHEIARRPGFLADAQVSTIAVYTALAREAAEVGEFAVAMDWIRQGRAAERPREKAASAVQWDVLEIRFKIAHMPHQEWAPDLAALIGRYESDNEASYVLTPLLLDLGLLQVVPASERGGDVMVDSRPLQKFLSLYGPQVATAQEYLGVSATKGEIWTPQSETGGSAIWTPGSEARGAGERPRIIVPGQ